MSAATSHYPLQPPVNSDSTSEKQQSSQHKRVYQACIPCRRRKVKCNLGSVDNPHDPPCTRCRRESKECYFSATRRKRKLPDGGGSSADGYEFEDDYVVRNGRKRLHSEASSEPPSSFRQSSAGGLLSAAPRSSFMDNAIISSPHPLTPGGHIGRSQPLRRPSPEPSLKRADNAKDDSNIHFENPEAQDVMRREVYGPHDALDLLYKAATDSPGHKGSRSGSGQISTAGHTSSPDMQRRAIPGSENSTKVNHMGPPDTRRDARIDPALSTENEMRPSRVNEPGYKDAIKAWSRFRFVRAGWFTAPEAIDYIDYYYEYLSPLTPISPPTFRNPGTHPTLLNEEPILSVTLLTISSRYRQMPGPGGHCRSHAIHEQLWTYLRGMIERCLWGQESFGGGFCGQGATEGEQTSSTAPWRGLRKGSLRTLGTVESLMILTEWHPRALHFPPQDATDELMLPSYDGSDSYSTDEDGNHRPPGVGGKRIESWLEPAWRSDRMCWMLLSTAMGLSYELGVFDQIEELLASGGDITRPEYEDEAYRLRAARIKKLLLLYVTQLAGRLGWTNMVPEHLRSSSAPEHRKRKASVDGNTPGNTTTPGTNTSISNAFNYIPDLELDDQIIHCWEGITHAMRLGNERLFRSRKHTTEIIQSNKYINLLKDFQPIFRNWTKTFEGYRLPQYMKHILVIEFEYVRIYVNSLSLQAVVERCTNNAGNTSNGQNGTTNGNLVMSPETQNYYGKLPLARLGGFTVADQEYVKEVVDGSRNLLRTVVEGLLPGGYLKHAPVRTYFRIISGAMFLLKTFALGATKNDVEVSIGLMDKAVDALRHCIVDDVHLGIRFADLLETLTSRLRNRFMHAPIPPPVSHDLVSGQTPQPRLENPPFEQLNGAEGRERNGNQGWNANTTGFHDPNIDGVFSSGISATPVDLGPGTLYGTGPFSSGQPNLYDLPDQVYSEEVDWNRSSDFWYLPPGPAFFQNSDQAITQTADGVNVGGIDLLDYMMDQYQPLDSSGVGHGF